MTSPCLLFLNRAPHSHFRESERHPHPNPHHRLTFTAQVMDEKFEAKQKAEKKEEEEERAQRPRMIRRGSMAYKALESDVTWVSN